MEQIYDMIVIGGGPAGYTAALYAARSGLSVVVLEKLSAGGQMALTEQIDNYPGFEDGIDGFTLGEKMQQSAERFGAVTELAEVYKASLSGKIKTLETSEGVFQGRTVVIATGASHRPLGVPGEETLIGKGVHYCAACDGAPYRGKTVAVVGHINMAHPVGMTHNRDFRIVHNILYKLIGTSGNEQIYCLMAGQQFVDLIMKLGLQHTPFRHAFMHGCLIDDLKQNFVGPRCLFAAF